MTNKPLNKFRDKTICITIWEGKNGGYQCKLEKSYKPKDSQEWKKTDTYFPDELERLVKLCNDARAWLHEQGNLNQDRKNTGLENVNANDFSDDQIPF